MRLPPATATDSFAVEMAELAALDKPELDLRLLALPALPADLGRLKGPLDARIHMELKGPHLLLHATAQGDLQLVCHRCLKEFPHHADLHVDEHMVVEAEKVADEELEWDMASLAETVDPNGELELVDWLRQHLILDLPAKQLCETACELPATAPPAKDEGDPRWASLRQLKSSQGDDHATT
jgi:uncharacterized metal-binding protein YceD (DUF177 family)